MNLDDAYNRILDRTPVMSAEEQNAVAARYARTRDPRDADRLVMGNLRLVVKVARQLGGPHSRDLMDLVQEGNAGLVHAIRRFDPKRGVKLTSYAVWWIRAFIMRHLMETSRMVTFASTREGRRRSGKVVGVDTTYFRLTNEGLSEGAYFSPYQIEKGRPVAIIDHPAGDETQWDWVDLPNPPAGWDGYGRTAHLLVGALSHSGKWRGVLAESTDARAKVNASAPATTRHATVIA